MFVLLETDRADYERNSDCQHRQRKPTSTGGGGGWQIAPIIVFDIVILLVVFWRRGWRRKSPNCVEGVNRLLLIKAFRLAAAAAGPDRSSAENRAGARKRQRSSQDAGAHQRRAGPWDNGADKSNRHAPCWR